ncbi:MAG: hypothetical protein BroJett015_15820 [Chloroflexota bacterium]|nr:MAG: hypothetical protein BroJett015_15820 [Chloroflexota bacterium]
MIADGWELQPSEADWLYFSGFTLAGFRFPYVAKIWPDFNRFVFYILLPGRAPKSRRLQVAEYLTQANYGLQIGNFEMDLTDGEVRYKSSIGFDGDALTPALIRQVIYPAVKAVEVYFPGLLKFVQAEPGQTIQTDSWTDSGLANGRLATDLLGFTAVDITDNPDLVAQRLDELFDGIKAFVTAVTGNDEAALESARQQLRGLQEVLMKHGLTTNEQMAELPDKIHAVYHQDQAKRRQDMAVGFEMLAEEMMGVATAVSQLLHTQAESYRQE